MIRRKILSPLLSRLGWRRLLLVLLVIGLAAGLLSARPWQARHPDCAVTVRPGESIQAAIDAAEAGDVICLARGVWTESMVIDKPLTVVGRGAGRTTIEAALISGPVGQVADQDAGPIAVRLEGLTISGRGGGSAVEISGWASAEVRDCAIFGQLYGVQVSDSASLNLTGSTVSGSPQRGIVLTGSARASIVGSRVQGNRGHGLWLSGSAEATLLASEVSGNGGHGFWLRDEARVVLTDSSVSSNGEHGILLTGQSEAQLARSQVSGNADQGIMAEDSVKLEMTDSQVLSNWHGIELAGEARATITGSTISRSRFDGVRVRHSAYAAISASVISANRRGVWIGGAGQAEIRDCLIQGNAGYGIFSSSPSEVAGDGNWFRANGVDLGGNLPGALRLPLSGPREPVITWPDDRYDSLQEAIDALLPGGKLLLEPGTYTAGLTIGKELSIEAGDGQVVLRAKSDALPVLSLVDGAELHLARVTISGGAEGLLISAGARAVLVACTISDNMEAINLSYSSSVEMMHCDIKGNERRGVFVGGAAQAAIIECSISNNSGYGIAAADFAQVTITDSIVTRSGGDGGIVLWASSQATLEGNTISDNRGFGVAIFQRPCFRASPWLFQGRISGSSNVFGTNRRGDVCPPELGFLSTMEGGELDLRP